uniref:Thioredoxin n=1 Tax=Euplotes harpa TaxID=151035 RepID=A0A7S3JH26_9SPIT
MVHVVKTLEEFKEKLVEAGDSLVVVDFFATWCPPCKYIAPILEKIAEDNQDVHFYKVDVDENSETSAEAKIECMPTFIFFKSGTEVHRIEGADEEAIKQGVSDHK